MCCLITILLLIGPRAAALVWALTDPARWQVFENPVLPCLGIVFLPWTLLAYVLVAPGGVEGLEWVLLIIAFLSDIGSTSGGAVKNRNRFPRLGERA
jgi:hypothetical protein